MRATCAFPERNRTETDHLIPKDYGGAERGIGFQPMGLGNLRLEAAGLIGHVFKVRGLSF